MLIVRSVGIQAAVCVTWSGVEARTSFLLAGRSSRNGIASEYDRRGWWRDQRTPEVEDNPYVRMLERCEGPNMDLDNSGPRMQGSSSLQG